MVERTKGALNPEKEDLLNWSRIWRDSHVSNGVNIKPLLLKICFQQKFSFFSIFQQNELESTWLIPPLKCFDNEIISKNSFRAKKLLIQSKQMKLHLRLVLLNKEIVEKLPKKFADDIIMSPTSPFENRNRPSSQFCKLMELRKLFYPIAILLNELMVIIYKCTYP